MSFDPATGLPLPDSAIQRVVFVTHPVHVYGIPPISSNKGFSASNWTSPTQSTAQEIFLARLRVIETSIDSRLKVDIVLEDGNTGELFAAAPYTNPAVVQQANDSSRFFAVRVVGEGGMKATLGIGFEDRSPALDFNIALGEARKVLGAEAGLGGRGAQQSRGGEAVQESKMDFSLKEGQKIHLQLGGKGKSTMVSKETDTKRDDAAALFSIAPPPSAGKATPYPNIPPPAAVEGKTAQELGFDDGEFGEFQ